MTTTRYTLTLYIPTDASELRAALITSHNEDRNTVTAEEAGEIAAEYDANGALYDNDGNQRGCVRADGTWVLS